jgi:hypothetical protein
MITSFLVFAIGMAQIEGQVFVAGMNETAAYARVALVRSGRVVKLQYANRDGRFRFAGVAPGRYTVSAGAKGYESRGAHVDLASGGSTATVVIELREKRIPSTRPTVVALREILLATKRRKRYRTL